jgi:hypothetical protein
MEKILAGTERARAALSRQKSDRFLSSKEATRLVLNHVRTRLVALGQLD